MAKKKRQPGTSQAGAIREGWQALGRRARGRDVVAYVDQHYPQLGFGKKSSASALVSQEKSNVFGRRRNQTKKKPAAARRAARTAVQANGTEDIQLLLDAREFVAKCGSADRAVAVLKQLRQLQVQK